MKVILPLALLFFLFPVSGCSSTPVPVIPQEPPPPPPPAGPPLQERYNSLNAPAMILFSADRTSAVPADVLADIEHEFLKQLVDGGKIKPVSMQRWLSSTFQTRAANPFVLMNRIRSERYDDPPRFIGKPVVFRSGEYFYFMLYAYSLETHYPITVLRRFDRYDLLPQMMSSSLEELYTRLFQPVQSIRRRVIIDDFRVEFYKLAELSSGEFEFLSAPFYENDYITLRDGDEFFSRVMGYALETTGLIQVLKARDFSEYSNASVNAGSPLVDYRIRGRVQLSDYECIVYIDLFDMRASRDILSLRLPLPSFSFDELLAAYRKLSVYVIEMMFDSARFAVVPTITSEGRYFFANNMLIGWDTLENYVLEKGLHIIATGTLFAIEYSDSHVNAFHVLLDRQSDVFEDTRGKHIWNLLNK